MNIFFVLRLCFLGLMLLSLQFKTIDDKEIIYAEWLCYFLHGKYEACHQIMEEKSEEIISEIMRSVWTQVMDYKYKKTQTIPQSIFAPIHPEFCTKLVKTHEKFLNERNQKQILVSRAFLVWQNGKYSEGLEDISKIWLFWGENLDDFKVKNYLGETLVLTTGVMLKTICDHKFLPAVDYLDVILERNCYTVPLLPYLLWIFYGQTEDFSHKAAEIYLKFPQIEKLKSEEFQNLFQGIEENRFKARRAIHKIHRYLVALNPEEFIEKIEEINSNPKFIQDMRDLSILELIQSKNFDQIFDYLKAEVTLPSMEVIKILVENVPNSQLESLRNCLPIDSKGRIHKQFGQKNGLNRGKKIERTKKGLKKTRKYTKMCRK